MTSHSPASSPELPKPAVVSSQVDSTMRAMIVRSFSTDQMNAHYLKGYEAGSAAAAQAAKQVPEGWVPCTITYAEGEDPEEVAFGPQRMMDRLKKWLDSYFEKVYADRYPIAAAPSATSLAEAAEAGQEKSQLAKDFPPMGGLTECDMGDSYE